MFVELQLMLQLFPGGQIPSLQRNRVRPHSLTINSKATYLLQRANGTCIQSECRTYSYEQVDAFYTSVHNVHTMRVALLIWTHVGTPVVDSYVLALKLFTYFFKQYFA